MGPVVFGDARYDTDAQMFRFNATLGGRTVRCVISIFAVEELAERSGDPARPLDLFEDFQHQIHDLVTRRYASYGGRQNSLILTILDVVCTRQH